MEYQAYRKALRDRWIDNEVLPKYKPGKKGREGLWEMSAVETWYEKRGWWMEGEWKFSAEFDSEAAA